MLHLTTFFDKNYLSRGLVLYHSLKEHNSNFELYILCLDDFTLNYFIENKAIFPEIKTLQLVDIEKDNQELLTAKSNRSAIEYYFTLSPILPLYLLEKFNLPHICSLDADILFINSPENIFKKIEEYSIVITPHKFSKIIEDKKKFGLYNVSFQIFKNNKIGLKCLNHWKTQCLEFCGDDFDEINERFADQKYLDNWLNLYPNSVFVLNDNVSGLAPWNLNNYKIEASDNCFYSNNEPIIFYHFHHFKIINSKWATNGFDEYKVEKQKAIDDLYLDYWKKIDFYNSQLAVSQDNSTRYNHSKNILPRLLKEKIVYKKINQNKIKQISFKAIPKFIRKLIIKIYG